MAALKVALEYGDKCNGYYIPEWTTPGSLEVLLAAIQDAHYVSLHVYPLIARLSALWSSNDP
jgi:hypothetical protein